MDKYEYKVRSEEIANLIDSGKYVEAVGIADTIDWRRVRSAAMLLKIAALYRVNRRNEDSREILLLAYEHYPTNRSVVYSLCELSIESDDVVAAIEYYKQFVKLAPRDTVVYTLRYRILEAQEASLDERIGILEELKRRDYQEEWAYELAYQYHRIGLATKCVEECDDIILWFGEGSYVMKAMELKSLHASLTDIQRAKYESLIKTAGNVYVEDDAADYGGENGPGSGYGQTGNGNAGEPDMEDCYGEDYGMGESGAPEVYADSARGDYYEADYAPDGYVGADDGYGGPGRAEVSLQGSGYTDGFYMEQPCDGNGVPADPANFGAADGSYADGPYAEEDYQGGFYGSGDYQGGYGQAYGSAPYPQPGYMAPSSNAVDMSQYNTINLQKVVAESMRELFPDDDVFGEEREESSAESLPQREEAAASGDDAGDTIAYTGLYGRKDTAKDAADIFLPGNPGTDACRDMGKGETQDTSVETGRVARMVAGVSETVPGPHTGAVSKVIVPGEDALFIKDEPDMDALRRTTEESVSSEHARMADNNENVYHPQSLMDTEKAAQAETPAKPVTGSMNLNNVLEEWERMKIDKAKEHQAEIKQHVLTQTGKILARFDSSIKSGILGELEREESGSGEERPPEGTAEIRQASDDDFDVAYEPETKAAGETVRQESPGYGPGPERAAGREPGGAAQDLPCADDADMADIWEPDLDPPEAESRAADAGTQELAPESAGYYSTGEYTDEPCMEEADDRAHSRETGETGHFARERYACGDRRLDPEDEEDIAEMAKEDALKTQEIKMSTADLSSLSEKIVAATRKEAKGAKREQIRDFTPEEQTLFENFAVTKKIRKQIIFALDNMTLAAYTGNVIITGDAGLDTVRMARNLVKEYHAADGNFSGKMAKITGEKINQRNLKDIFDKLDNGGIIIEKANGMSEQKLYEMAALLNQENLGIIVIMEDTKKEITRLLEKQAMIADYFNIRIDLMEMDINALVAYAKNYALALEYSIDELGTLALYTRIANMQSGNHVVTKDEVRGIIDEAIWKSRKPRIKNFVDVLFARRYDGEDMIVLKERDFM